MHVLSLPQNKFGLIFFRLFDGALETSNFCSVEVRSAITLLRCFLPENRQRGKIARVKFAEELGTMSKNRLRWITLVRGPIWGIHSLTLMISCLRLFSSCLRLPRKIHLNYPCLLLEKSCRLHQASYCLFLREKVQQHRHAYKDQEAACACDPSGMSSSTSHLFKSLRVPVDDCFDL